MIAPDDDQMAQLLVEHAGAVDDMVQSLERYGYQPVDEHPGHLRRGARVRHRGHQYPQAFWHGTAVVAAVLQARPGDVEVVVVTWSSDPPRVAQWADYGCTAVGRTLPHIYRP